jgi:hypothetical protein
MGVIRNVHTLLFKNLKGNCKLGTPRGRRRKHYGRYAIKRVCWCGRN